MGYCCRPKTVPCRVRCVCKRTVVLLSTYYCMCNSKSMATARLVALLSTALTTSVQRGARRAAWTVFYIYRYARSERIKQLAQKNQKW